MLLQLLPPSGYSGSDILNDIVIILICYAYVIMAILIPVALKKKDKISKFTARKMVHLFAGLVVLLVPFFVWPIYAIFVAFSLTLLVYLSSKESNVKQLRELYESISEEAEEKKGRLSGPLNYCISITVLIGIFAIFAPTQLYYPISGILIMIIADTLASVIGKKYGKHEINIRWTGTKRTVEGSTVFFVSAFILCLFSFYFFGYLNLSTSQQQLLLPTVIIFALVTAAISTVIELLSYTTTDDLSVPILTTLIIWLLGSTLI